MNRLLQYEEDSAPALALKATIERTEKRFATYAKQGLLCGTDGLPHLISDPGLAIRYGHAGETLVRASTSSALRLHRPRLHRPLNNLSGRCLSAHLHLTPVLFDFEFQMGPKAANCNIKQRLKRTSRMSSLLCADPHSWLPLHCWLHRVSGQGVLEHCQEREEASGQGDHH